MLVKIKSFGNGTFIPNKFAFCRLPMEGEEGPVAMSDNINPSITWENVPEGTKSFALLCIDPFVPSVADDVNQLGKVVPKDLPRIDFFHWVICDIPASRRSIDEGEDSSAITPRGKDIGAKPYGLSGINNYTHWFASDPNMSGNYGGYDGPCPPWNDSIMHEYHFHVFALDVPTLNLSGAFTGQDVQNAMKGHIIDSASAYGIFSLNKDIV